MPNSCCSSRGYFPHRRSFMPNTCSQTDWHEIFHAISKQIKIGSCQINAKFMRHENLIHAVFMQHEIFSCWHEIFSCCMNTAWIKFVFMPYSFWHEIFSCYIHAAWKLIHAVFMLSCIPQISFKFHAQFNDVFFMPDSCCIHALFMPGNFMCSLSSHMLEGALMCGAAETAWLK